LVLISLHIYGLLSPLATRKKMNDQENLP